MTVDAAITPVHTRVRGRGRYKVPGLRRTENCKRRLEMLPLRHADIYRVCASTTTGNALVWFHPDRTHREIAARLETAIGPDRGATPMQTPDAAEPPAWHRMSKEAVLADLQVSDAQGLSSHEVAARIRQWGRNRPRVHRRRSDWKIIRDQMLPVPLALSGGLILVEVLTGRILQAAATLAIIGTGSLAGYWIERRTESALAAAVQKTCPRAEVIREGQRQQVPGEDLVPGDLLVLKPGTFVGADGRVLSEYNLKIDESMLTGESIPVEKTAAAAATTDPTAETANLVHMGTLVVGGEGLAVVTATGTATRYGALHALVGETLPPRTPLIGQLQRLFLQTGRYGAVAGLVAFLLRRMLGAGLLDCLHTALSLTAAVVPAGTPSTATVNLAVGAARLKRQRISLQRFCALETLGALDLVCFDKTGTLTRSRITVLRMAAGGRWVKVKDRKFFLKDRRIDPRRYADLRTLIRACVLCNESKIQAKADGRRMELQGSPTEKALLFMAFLSRSDLLRIYREHPLLAVRHRSAYRRCMFTVHRTSNGKGRVVVKGDPMQVLAMCAGRRCRGRSEAFTDAVRRRIETENDRMAAAALRVLGFASKEIPDPERLDFNRLETDTDFTWIGQVGMAEPIRQGVKELIDELHTAGIRTVMITGDQSLTAGAVAQRIGLAGSNVLNTLDSARFDVLDPAVLKALTRNVSVFSRVNPDQKLQIVQAFRNAGYTVAMTGDGINDGPAMRAADLGIAMGISGTDVARETADVVLENDDLANLGAAVSQGRLAYRNLKHSVLYQFTVNAGELLLSLGALGIPAGGCLFGGGPPVLSAGLETLPALALLLDPGRGEAMGSAPYHPRRPIFSGVELRRALADAAWMAGGALVGYGWGCLRYGAGRRAAALAFHCLAANRQIHALTLRPDSGNGGNRNRWLTAAVGAGLGIQLLTLLVPGLRSLSGIGRPNPADLGFLAAQTAACMTAIRIRHRSQIEAHVI